MKKNILTAYSLLVLPLITSSSLLSMDFGPSQEQQPHSQDQFHRELQVTQAIPTPTITTQKVERNSPSHEDMLQDLRQSMLFQQQAVLNTSTVKDDSENFDIPSFFEYETIQLPLPDCMTAQTNITKEQPNILSNQTIFVEKVKREPTLGEKITYYTSTHHQWKNTVLSLIEKGEFKVGDEVHETWLAVAIKHAIDKDNIKFLIDVANLCDKNEQYRNSLRISEELSKELSEKINQHYTTQLEIAEEALQKKQQEKVNQWNESVTKYRKKSNDDFTIFTQEIKQLHDNYDQSVKQETEQVNGLRGNIALLKSVLDRSIRPNTETVLTKNQMQTPKELFVATMKDAQQRINSAQQEINAMPTIKACKTMPQYMIEHTNKK